LSLNYQSEDFRAGYLLGRTIARENCCRRISGLIIAIASISLVVLLPYMFGDLGGEVRNHPTPGNILAFCAVIFFGGITMMGGSFGGLTAALGGYDRKEEVII